MMLLKMNWRINNNSLIWIVLSVLLSNCKNKSQKIEFGKKYKYKSEYILFYEDGKYKQVYGTCKISRIKKYSLDGTQITLYEHLRIDDQFHCDGLDTNKIGASVFDIKNGHLMQGDIIYDLQAR